MYDVIQPSSVNGTTLYGDDCIVVIVKFCNIEIKWISQITGGNETWVISKLNTLALIP